MSDPILAGVQRNITRGMDKLNLSTPKEKLNNTQLLADTGLSIIHINRVGFGRSMTVAYKGTSKTMVELATAITHPDDTFSRKVGTKQAVAAFTAGRTIRVPVDPIWQGRVNEFVKTLFNMV